MKVTVRFCMYLLNGLPKMTILSYKIVEIARKSLQFYCFCSPMHLVKVIGTWVIECALLVRFQVVEKWISNITKCVHRKRVSHCQKFLVEHLKKESVKRLIPNIAKLLRIYFTIPVTTATAERSFSTLRRVKNYLRSSMTQQRLNHCLIAHCHQTIDED